MVQAQCVHNIAASCSTITTTYHCNQHTNFQTLQPHKQFTIQIVRTHSLHFPCTHSNKLLSLKSLYNADLTASQQHTLGNASSTTPILSASFHSVLCTGCPRRNGQNFRRVFLMLKYTDITQNTYTQS